MPRRIVAAEMTVMMLVRMLVMRSLTGKVLKHALPQAKIWTWLECLDREQAPARTRFLRRAQHAMVTVVDRMSADGRVPFCVC